MSFRFAYQDLWGYSFIMLPTFAVTIERDPQDDDQLVAVWLSFSWLCTTLSLAVGRDD